MFSARNVRLTRAWPSHETRSKFERATDRLAWVFVDEYGVRFGTAILVGFAILGVIVVLIGGGVKIASEASCNKQVERIHSERVVDGDYDFWAGNCYVELTDGTAVPLDGHRTFERKEVID